MAPYSTKRRAAITSLLAALSMVLTGCFLTPGKFDSTLTLTKDNSFTLTYEGEMFFLPLAPGAMKDNIDTPAEFGGGYCFNDETYEERECSEEERAQQKADWEIDQSASAKNEEERLQQVAAALGGIDPKDPEAGNKMAQMLERQRGWNSVRYMGNGTFQVSYAITGQLGHDISFPMIEGIPSIQPFVQVILRDENTVRVNAPGFAKPAGDNPMTGLLMGGFTQGINESLRGDATADPEDTSNNVPQMRGTFRIITDGKVLANNTDEGPSSINGRDTLSWDIAVTTSAAPTALINLGE